MKRESQALLDQVLKARQDQRGNLATLVEKGREAARALQVELVVQASMGCLERKV